VYAKYGVVTEEIDAETGQPFEVFEPILMGITRAIEVPPVHAPVCTPSQACPTGFTCPLQDLPEIGVGVFGRSRLPSMTNYWESAGVPGIYFAGTIGQGAGGTTCPCDAMEDGVTNPAAINGNTRQSLSADDDGVRQARAGWGYHDAALEELEELRISERTARGYLAGHEPLIFRPEDLRRLTQDSGSVLFDNRPLYAVAPLNLEQGKMGLILATAPALGDYEFSERKIRLLMGIAHQAKTAIESITSFESLEETFLSTIESLANALEAKDEYTSSHARWITDMSLEVGHALGLEGPELKRLELGALFHDIGKIGIPTDILSKPGPLTDQEWAIVKAHPEMGERILAPIERLGDVRRIIRHCHEHYDGSGYPDGKAGDDIPIESRIILVVDAFHAMTSDRPYRKGMSKQRALTILKEEAGKQFDPHVVGIFLQLISGERKLELA
jgi:hypothetical protein